MAFKAKPVNAWRVIRSVISALFVLATVWVAIADWPNCRIWQLVLEGNAYYLWEFVILFAAWHGVITWTLYLETGRRNDVRVFVVRPDGLGEADKRKREGV